MQKKARLFALVVLAFLVAIFFVVIVISGVLFPAQAESRVAIVFNNEINKDNFVEATEGAQKILNTMVNVADFSEVRNKVINSGFVVTENVFNGTADENTSTWDKSVSIKPINESFVLKITAKGRNRTEAKELAGVIAHEVSLEIPMLFKNLRGLSDQSKIINDKTGAILGIFLVVVIIIICLCIVFYFFRKDKIDDMSTKRDLNKIVAPSDKKQDENPRYFLQKFLEEHQEQKVD